MQAITIIINHSFRENMSPGELYEATRKSWVISEQKRQARYGLAVVRGVVKEVYRIDYWELVINNKWKFFGEIAPDKIRNGCIGREVERSYGAAIRHIDLEEFMRTAKSGA